MPIVQAFVDILVLDRVHGARGRLGPDGAGFSGRLRDEVELETLTAELLGVVAATMQPVRTTLWLHDSEAPMGVVLPAAPAES